MNNSKLVIFGTRSFAALAHYYFKHDSAYSVRAFAVDKEYLRESSLDGLPVVVTEQLVSDFPSTEYDVFVAIGIGQINRQRANKVAEIEALGYRTASFVSSKATVANDVVIHPNTMVMDQTLVQPSVRIGKDSTIFPGSMIGFRSQLGEHCWIVSATVGESVHLGSYSFLGVKAVVAPNVTLGESCVVGAGAVVLRDAGNHALFRAARSDRRTVPERMRRTFGINRPGS